MFDIASFHTADDFLETLQTTSQPDIIFMDIDMPGTNGMDAARKLRTKGCASILIFVTTLAQYAINGYEVNAVDFILKPLTYLSFKMRMDKAMALCASDDDLSFPITDNRTTFMIKTRDISYVETQKHNTIFHVTHGQYTQRGSLSSLEKQLGELYESGANPFLRINSCYLINMDFVAGINSANVIMKNGDELSVSRPRKKHVMQEITQYLGMRV